MQNTQISALDSAGVETENEEVPTGAKKSGIKFIISSLKLLGCHAAELLKKKMVVG